MPNIFSAQREETRDRGNFSKADVTRSSVFTVLILPRFDFINSPWPEQRGDTTDKRKGRNKHSVSKYSALLGFFTVNNVSSCLYPPLSSSQYNTLLNRKIESKITKKRDFKEREAAEFRHFQGRELQTKLHSAPPPGKCFTVWQCAALTQ